MNLPPDDKDFELAVEKAIDEIFGEVEAETSKKEIKVIEDDSLKIPLELEPVENERKEDRETKKEEIRPTSKVIDFPTIDDIIKPEIEVEKKEVSSEVSIKQEDLEKLAAALLSLEWEVNKENAITFLNSLEEIKNKSPEKIHSIINLIHEVGLWLKDRPEEARPEWFHFLHQGIVALNLITLQGKESDQHYEQLKKSFLSLKKSYHQEEVTKGDIKNKLLKQLLLDYQRFTMLEHLFSRSPKTKSWQKVCQKALKEIEETINFLPIEERPNLAVIKEKILENVKRKRQVRKEKPIISTHKGIPFREGYQCIIGEKIYFIPEEQVSYFGPFKPSWRKKIDGLFPLKLLLGFWAYFSFVKLKNKFTGSLAQKEEKELRNMVLPILKRVPNPQVILILWNGHKGGVILAEEAQFFIIPNEATLAEKEGEIIIIINDRELPVLMVK